MFERAVRIDAGFAAAWVGLANAHVDLFRWGRNPRDLEEAQRYNAACNLALLGESEHALDGLERALEAGVSVGDWIQHDPDFKSLRSHPRFQAIVKRIAPT